jgi:hypothetical protein
MADSFEDRIKQAVQTEQNQIANRSEREHQRDENNERGRLAASAFAGAIIGDIVKPKMYAARRALPNDSSVSVSADDSSRRASLTAPVHPGSNASCYIVVRFNSTDTLALEANLTRPDDDNGKRIDPEQARFQQFKVADGERPSIEKWVDDQLVSLVPELLRACS